MEMREMKFVCSRHTKKVSLPSSAFLNNFSIIVEKLLPHCTSIVVVMKKIALQVNNFSIFHINRSIFLRRAWYRFILWSQMYFRVSKVNIASQGKKKEEGRRREKSFAFILMSLGASAMSVFDRRSRFVAAVLLYTYTLDCSILPTLRRRLFCIPMRRRGRPKERARFARVASVANWKPIQLWVRWYRIIMVKGLLPAAPPVPFAANGLTGKLHIWSVCSDVPSPITSGVDVLWSTLDSTSSSFHSIHQESLVMKKPQYLSIFEQSIWAHHFEI